MECVATHAEKPYKCHVRNILQIRESISSVPECKMFSPQCTLETV